MQKALFFLKTPPPVTGATLMNQRICNSEYLEQSLDIAIIHLNYASNTRNLGRITINKTIKFFKYIIVLTKTIYSFKPDFIYFQISPTGVAFFRDSIFVIIMKLFRRKIIFHLRGKGIDEYVGKSRFLIEYYRHIFKNTYLICLSELLTYDIRKVFDGTPYIVYNGIPVFNYSCLEKDNRDINILFLSNLIEEKGIYDFIGSLYSLFESGYDAKGTIIGQESDVTAEELQLHIDGLGLQNKVKYLGPKYGDEKYEAYCKADIFVFPTYYHVETWGGVILEAMQFGLPVISTFEGSIPLIIDDGINGFLVDAKSQKQIMEKLIVLIDDPELRKKMGQSGKEKFHREFTFKIFEENLFSVFSDVLTK